MKKVFGNQIFCWIGLIVVILTSVFVILKIFTSAKEPPKDRIAEIKENYKIYSPPIPEKVDFAGEKVPLEYFDVKRALDYELLKIMYWHSETILYLKRANEVFPIVEPILKKYGVPDDFKYLLVAESGMVNVTSPAGAKGYWQFMENTAKEFGLEVNDCVDERYNLEKSTEAACKYILKAYRQFKSWTLAAASYNVGRDRLKKTLENQKVNNFYDLLINRETTRYIYRIIAFKLIMTNPENYGFRLEEQDLYHPVKYKIVEVDSSISNLVNFALQQGTNYKLLKKLNPWLISNKLDNPNHKTYKIKILTSDNRKGF